MSERPAIPKCLGEAGVATLVVYYIVPLAETRVHGKKGFKATLRKKIDDDLAYSKATPNEGEQIYRTVIHRLAP